MEEKKMGIKKSKVERGGEVGARRTPASIANDLSSDFFLVPSSRAEVDTHLSWWRSAMNPNDHAHITP